MSRAILKLKLADEIMSVPILKIVKLATGLGFMLGTECSDHDFWTQQPGEPVKLAGTFTPQVFDRIKKTKARDVVELKHQDFEWLNPKSNTTTPLRAESTTLGILKLDLSEPFAADAAA